MDVDAAIRTFGPLSADLVIAYNGDAHELGVDIARETAGVILGPFDSSTPPRTLATPAAFTQAGASVALAGRLPEGPAVGPRLTAALAVRYGMKPDQARAAITSTAARIAGVDRRVGAIKPGLDADLVIFSDDPLRFDSRPLAVYVDGVRVWSELGRRANTSDGYGVSP
jgi:imidazolonepropionase-like amidohydrolase